MATRTAESSSAKTRVKRPPGSAPVKTDAGAGTAIAPVPAFRPVRPARAFEEIADQIRNDLAEGRLKVGSRLPSERALAEQFGVSRNTLREALRSLEHAGLIRLQKGARGGAFISERIGQVIITGLLDLYHLGSIGPAELTEARIWLESIIVREACARATVEDIAELNRNIAEAEAATVSGNFALRAEKNIDFHRILTRMSGNPVMVILMNGVLDVLHHFVRTIGEHPNTYVLPSRRRFVKHIEEGHVDAAVAEMETSLKRLQRSYLSLADAAGQKPRTALQPAAARGRRGAASKPDA